MEVFGPASGGQPDSRQDTAFVHVFMTQSLHRCASFLERPTQQPACGGGVLNSSTCLSPRYEHHAPLSLQTCVDRAVGTAHWAPLSASKSASRFLQGPATIQLGSSPALRLRGSSPAVCMHAQAHPRLHMLDALMPSIAWTASWPQPAVILGARCEACTSTSSSSLSSLLPSLLLITMEQPRGPARHEVYCAPKSKRDAMAGTPRGWMPACVHRRLCRRFHGGVPPFHPALSYQR